MTNIFYLMFNGASPSFNFDIANWEVVALTLATVIQLVTMIMFDGWRMIEIMRFISVAEKLSYVLLW